MHSYLNFLNIEVNSMFFHLPLISCNLTLLKRQVVVFFSVLSISLTLFKNNLCNIKNNMEKFPINSAIKITDLAFFKSHIWPTAYIKKRIHSFFHSRMCRNTPMENKCRLLHLFKKKNAKKIRTKVFCPCLLANSCLWFNIVVPLNYIRK